MFIMVYLMCGSERGGDSDRGFTIGGGGAMLLTCFAA